MYFIFLTRLFLLYILNKLAFDINLIIEGKVEAYDGTGLPRKYQFTLTFKVSRLKHSGKTELCRKCHT